MVIDCYKRGRKSEDGRRETEESVVKNLRIIGPLWWTTLVVPPSQPQADTAGRHLLRVIKLSLWLRQSFVVIGYASLIVIKRVGSQNTEDRSIVYRFRNKICVNLC